MEAIRIYADHQGFIWCELVIEPAVEERLPVMAFVSQASIGRQNECR